MHHAPDTLHAYPGDFQMKLLNKKNIYMLSIIIFTFFILIVQDIDLFARAGGAGGDGGFGGGGGGGSFGGGGYGHFSGVSGGGGSGSGIESLMLFLIIIIIVVLIFNNARKKYSIFNKMPPVKTIELGCEGYNQFLQENPDFNLNEFFAKVKTAFISIQTAWAEKNLSNVRRFISDGVYQRFNTQFKMMTLLKQNDIISNVTIRSAAIDRVEQDGDYDILHVAVEAGMNDKFVSETMPNLEFVPAVTRNLLNIGHLSVNVASQQKIYLLRIIVQTVQHRFRKI